MKAKKQEVHKKHYFDDGAVRVELLVPLPFGTPVYVYIRKEPHVDGRACFTGSDEGETMAYARAMGVGFLNGFEAGVMQRARQLGGTYCRGEIVVQESTPERVIEVFEQIVRSIYGYISSLVIVERSNRYREPYRFMS